MVASRQLFLLVSSSETKQRTHKAKRVELNGLVVHVLTCELDLLWTAISCGARYELHLFLKANTKHGRWEIKKHTKWPQKELGCKGNTEGN
jgi:hypothetical protein